MAPVNPVKRLLFFFTAYYFSQGIYNSFSGFETRLLISKHVSLTDISASRSVAIIPWSIKILFAIPCDMIGRRLPFVAVGMILGASLLASLSDFDPAANYPAYISTVFARNVGIALSDVAVDGMSVDSGLEDMAGTVQGFMSLGRVCGTLLGSAIGAPIAKESFSGMIIFLSVIIFLLVPVVFLVKEEKISGKNEDFEWSAFRELLKPSIGCFLLYSMIGNLAGSIVGGGPSTKWGEEVVGLGIDEQGYLNVVASLGDLVGAVGMGVFFDRIDKRVTMFATAILSCVMNLVGLWSTTVPSWFALGFFGGIASGALFVVQCGMVMRLADKRLGASVFAIAVSFFNFSNMIGSAIGGPLADAYDLKVAFWVSFAVNLLQIPFVFFIVEPPKKLQQLPPQNKGLDGEEIIMGGGSGIGMIKNGEGGKGGGEMNGFIEVQNILHNNRGGGGGSSPSTKVAADHIEDYANSSSSSNGNKPQFANTMVVVGNPFAAAAAVSTAQSARAAHVAQASRGRSALAGVSTANEGHDEPDPIPAVEEVHTIEETLHSIKHVPFGALPNEAGVVASTGMIGMIAASLLNDALDSHHNHPVPSNPFAAAISLPLLPPAVPLGSSSLHNNKSDTATTTTATTTGGNPFG